MKGFKAALLIIALFFSASSVAAEAVAFSKPQLSVTEDQFYLVLHGNLGFTFSQAALEALDNGLPLTISTEISIVDPGKWFWNKEIWSANYSQQIYYHALSQQYLVKDIQSSYPTAALSRGAAIQALGDIKRLKLVENSVLGSMERYEVQLTTHLDINSLPTPLRPLAYLSEDWRLQGKWKTRRTR